MIQYTIINSALNHGDQPAPDMTVLKSIHNAGFFSCSTIALMDAIHYYNENKGLPDQFDRTEQYMHYKAYAGQDLITYYFDQWSIGHVHAPYEGAMPMPYDCMSIQFTPYRTLPIDDWMGITAKYFHPSDHIGNIAYNLKVKYNLDYDNTCAVFFRGNDKKREMSIAPYEAFIQKAREVKEANPNIRFLVQPDETEFLNAFLQEFPNSVFFEETPHISKQDSAVFYELPRHERAEYGARFFAAVLCISKCSQIITHSGNCGLWACLYRGNANNVMQYFNGAWI